MHAVRRTGRPGPRFNYELFNCNNFNIRYWSWNYRGCWPCKTPIKRRRPGTLDPPTGAALARAARGGHPRGWEWHVPQAPRPGGRHLAALYVDTPPSFAGGHSTRDWPGARPRPPSNQVSCRGPVPRLNRPRPGVGCLWRQQRGVLRARRAPPLDPPDLPSNCSSLRYLNCTHSNSKTQKSPGSVFIVTCRLISYLYKPHIRR